MNVFVKALFWFLILAFVALLFNFWLGDRWCGVCNSNAQKSVQEPVIQKDTTQVKEALAEFVIATTDGKSMIRLSGSFIIHHQDATVHIPASMQAWKDSIYSFMNAHQDKELIISAKYLQNEGIKRGVDRAKFLTDLLVQYGVNPDRIVPQAVLSDYSYDDEGNYDEGIAMVFNNLPKDLKVKLEKEITDKTLYTAFGSTEFIPDRTLKAYVFELKEYLENHPGKKVSITGHTDNVGSAASNYRLGLKRAQRVMAYFISQGIDRNRLQSLSKGETEPVASNDTEEGQARNRRIHIEVK